MIPYTSEEKLELKHLCETVRTLVRQEEYKQCREIVLGAMGKYPHAPEPHNLLGVLLEKEADYAAAMKHYRAAWALDPAYRPARYNLDRYASFYAVGNCAFDEVDCPASDDDETGTYRT